MPRIKPGLLALVGALVTAAAAIVLYVILANPVHDRVPPALSALTRDATPKPPPSAALIDADGHPHSLNAFKGRVVVLNMWATWCAPCVRELPALGRLEAALHDQNFAVITVNASRDTGPETASFLKSHGAADLPAYRDPDLSLLSAFGSQGLPFSVLIDAKGREIARASGPVPWDDPAAIAYFRSLATRGAS